MYAIVQAGGDQVRVAAGDTISVEKISGEPATEVVFDKVLMIEKDGAVVLGKPYVAGAKVKAEIVSTAKTDKVLVLKHQPKKAMKKLTGHRQLATTLKIKEIIGG